MLSSPGQALLCPMRIISLQHLDYKIEVLALTIRFDNPSPTKRRQSRIIQPRMPASIPTRPLGRDGPQIPALGLGLMGLSSKPPIGEHLQMGKD